MTLSQFQESLLNIINIDGIGLNMFFLLQGEDNLILKRANIIEDVKDELQRSYLSQLRYYATEEELSLMNLSAADDRRSAIYNYDLEEKPGIFEYFDDLMDTSKPLADYPVFNFINDDLSDLEGYFVRIGDQDSKLVIYRKQMPINLFKRGKIYLVKGHETQFTKIDQEFLRIDTKIDVINLIGEQIITNINILERHYEFTEIIMNEATASLESIAELDLLDNLDVLTERVSDVRFARKLAKLSTTSPVFTLERIRILQFARQHASLRSSFKFDAVNGKIILDTKKSQEQFLKLMNDDYLHSQLTDFDYVTPAKDKVESIAE